MSFSVSPSLGFWLLTGQSALTTSLRSAGISVTVYPSWYKHIAVEWSVPTSFGACLFNVYFSQTEDGPFEKLNPTPIDGTYLIDSTTLEFSKSNHGYYVVEAILQDQNSATLRSNPTTWYPKQRRWVELRSIEIQRREYWLLSRFAGIKSYLFRRKNYGQRCSSCWNYELEKVMDDHCPNCFGTSFEGGYFKPAPFYVQYDASQRNLAQTYFGKYEPNQIGGWTISIPEIRPGDIIVKTGEWDVYKVERVTPTELQGNPVRQMLVLTQLAKGDVESKLVANSVPDFPAEYR